MINSKHDLDQETGDEEKFSVIGSLTSLDHELGTI